MKIATFNIQNLFHRDKSLVNIQAGNAVINWLNEMDHLMRKYSKTVNDLDRIKDLSFLLGFEKISRKSYAVMRRRGGALFFRGCHSSGEIKANSLTDWNGWVALQTIPVDPVATQNKARVIAEVNADVLLLQEVEDRNSLLEFNNQFLPEFNGVPYRELLVLQGNDGRGQEMGMLTKNGFKIQEVRTYGNEIDDIGMPIFDKNLVKYEITTPSKNKICLLAVHLQEQGKDKENFDVLRFRQAHRVAEIYQQLRSQGQELVIVAGTLNAVSYCFSLSPLLQKTDLKDVSKHPSFNVAGEKEKDAGYLGMKAYRKGLNIKQRDYLLLSPEMFSRVKNSGLNRKATWSERASQWPVYSTIKNEKQAASEHPVVWGEIEI
jgi:endonuclease/exonuclease/phosphatase family metal-dependent hydrolase